MGKSQLAQVASFYYEREKIYADIGSKEAKFAFLDANPEVASFKKDVTIFYRSGLFQLADGPPILVLPWFLKEVEQNTKHLGFLNLFDTLKDIMRLKESFIDITIDEKMPLATEILIYSFLIKVEEKIDTFISKNHYVGINEKTKTVKGKWDARRDLTKTDRPLNFSCNYGTVNLNIPFLIFLKSFIAHLKSYIKSKRSLHIIEKINSKLQSIDNQKISLKLIRDAMIDLKKRNFLREWIFSIDFAYEFISSNFESVKQSGLSYSLKLDKFFEELVSSILKRGTGSVMEQQRQNIFGGSRWTTENESQDDIEEEVKAQIYSIPDLIFYDEKTYNVIECKYKPFALPLVGIKDDQSVAFGPADRNQLLSFLLGLKPSVVLSKRKVTFTVIYPCRNTSDANSVSLTFNHASFKIDSAVKTIIQKTSNFSLNESFNIRYIGINIATYLQALKDGNVEIFQNFFNLLLASNEKTYSSIDISIKNQKRAAAACMVVNEMKNDNTLGRIKMAKVLYLLDTHFNLDISSNYYRAAAGPLDQEMIYGKDNSIESLCSKNSYFKVHEQRNKEKKIERVRYSSSVNLEEGLGRAKKLFFGFHEDMLGMITKVSKLDTDRIEIVATLYACWNDLILSGDLSPEDSVILDEFSNRWHPSKKRFEKERLQKALEWMRNSSLAPFGNGKSTKQF